MHQIIAENALHIHANGSLILLQLQGSMGFGIPKKLKMITLSCNLIL